MRKALIVGIDQYRHLGTLSGCVNDAYSVKSVLERHADGTVNFPTPKMMIGNNVSSPIEKTRLKHAVRDLFSDDSEIALFYFAGHGHVDDTGGFLCAIYCETGDDGFSLNEVMTIVSQSPAKNKIVILDSCHSGVAGNNPSSRSMAELKEGVTVLTASTAEQYAMETPGGGSGIFTNLLVDALRGGAGNLVGDVTPGSIYAHIDQSLGPWSQRPVFKTNVKTFISLRRATPPIGLTDLHQLPILFPVPGYQFNLDPSFEPERSKDQETNSSIVLPNPKNTAIFAILQKYNRVNLVRPVDAPHMWHAAMQSKSCELTVLGEHYRNLVENGVI